MDDSKRCTDMFSSDNYDFASDLIHWSVVCGESEKHFLSLKFHEIVSIDFQFFCVLCSSIKIHGILTEAFSF